MTAIKTKTPEQLKAWRIANGKTQTDLAIIMGYSTKSYGQIVKHEKGTKPITDLRRWENMKTWCKLNQIKY